MSQSFVLRRSAGALLVALAALVGVTFTPLSAQAATFNCSAPVTQAGGVLGNQVSSVQQAVNRLATKGAAVHVVAVSSYNSRTYANVGAFASSIQAQCSSWQLPSAVNLVITGTLDSKLLFGTRWNLYLSSRESGIESGIASQGTVGAGTVYGLNQVYSALPASSSQGSGTSRTAQSVNPSSHKGSDPGTIFVIVLLILVGAGLLVGGGVLVVRLLRNRTEQTAERHEEDSRRRRAQRAAVIARDDANEQVQALSGEPDRLTTLAASLPSNTIPPASMAATNDAISRLRDLLGSANLILSGRNRGANMDPDTPNLVAAEYEQIGQAYSGVLADAQQAQALITRIEAAVRQLQTDPNAKIDLNDDPAPAASASRPTAAASRPYSGGSYQRPAAPAAPTYAPPPPPASPRRSTTMRPTFLSRGTSREVADAVEAASAALYNAELNARRVQYYLRPDTVDTLWQAREQFDRIETVYRNETKIRHARRAEWLARQALAMVRDDVADGVIYYGRRDFRPIRWMPYPWWGMETVDPITEIAVLEAYQFALYDRDRGTVINVYPDDQAFASQVDTSQWTGDGEYADVDLGGAGDEVSTTDTGGRQDDEEVGGQDYTTDTGQDFTVDTDGN